MTNQQQSVHPILQAARGLCTDEASYPVIDQVLAEAVDRAKDLEDEHRRLREALERIAAEGYRGGPRPESAVIACKALHPDGRLGAERG